MDAGAQYLVVVRRPSACPEPPVGTWGKKTGGRFGGQKGFFRIIGSNLVQSEGFRSQSRVATGV
ncbi:hypothetical protein MPNT_10026 [Candidatus Methylacidithermus pantelleriae]|uniref:Uncharacterized protein n=1 Tax=Candidatus Methylacidithermus pantelleriae TaxID=2744239 RepID=A0A8J2BJ10_9BACT|nr:hypothetical protein MPNT_10026 [Candidatus Methylacidithermus pantelleriae]